MIRSLIDYHSVNLLDSKKTRTKKIASIQNNAIRIALGCTSSARTECARSKVGLSGVEVRIKEFAVLQLIRSIDTEDNNFFTKFLPKPQGKREATDGFGCVAASA